MAFGTTEIIVILAVVILLFGAAAIPKLARALGRAQGEFSKAKREFHAEADRAASESDKPEGPPEEQIRRTARELGIDDEGKSVEDLKRLINEKLA